MDADEHEVVTFIWAPAHGGRNVPAVVDRSPAVAVLEPCVGIASPRRVPCACGLVCLRASDLHCRVCTW